ncbi:MAG: TetR/AcrR family transcriptional regulator [Paucibacter sp.]|nr:TetR/AcrR family transcriptional regulator [Roseateles sp.]
MSDESVRGSAGARARAQRLSPEERREQLLACAVKVFSERGLGGGNHALVAAEAKVSVPTVFVYFKTHEALVDAVLDEVEQIYLAKMVHAESAEMPALEAILHLSQGLTQTLDTHPAHARLFREWSVCVHSEHWPRYLRLYRKLTRALAKAIERGQRDGSIHGELNAEDEAAILYAGAMALMQMIETGAPADRLNKFQRSMILPVLTLNALPIKAVVQARPADPKRSGRAVKAAY